MGHDALHWTDTREDLQLQLKSEHSQVMHAASYECDIKYDAFLFIKFLICSIQ